MRALAAGAHTRPMLTTAAQGDWKGSMNTLKRVVDLVPGWAMPQRDLGSLLFNRGDVWGAVYHWTIAVRTVCSSPPPVAAASQTPDAP